MTATTLTHDVKNATGPITVEVHLPGQPFGLDASHDPANLMGVPAESVQGPGGYSVGFRRHANLDDEIRLELANVTGAVKDAFADLLAEVRQRKVEVKYSPLGSSSYGTETYQLVSTLADWQEDAYHRWSGEVVLMRKGS